MQALLVLLIAGGLQPTPDDAGPVARCAVFVGRGATRPEGGTARMLIVSDGLPCGITSWGVPSERRNGATSAVLTQQPQHGRVVFVAPRMLYTAEVGYAGPDAFAFEATATSLNDSPIVLRMKVDVDVKRERFARTGTPPGPGTAGPPPVGGVPGGMPAASPPMARPVAPRRPANADPDLEEGLQLMERGKYEDALKAFKRANDRKGKSCAECAYAMARAYEALKAFKNAVDSCNRAIELAGDDTHLLIQARQTKGLALQGLAEVKDQKLLSEAEAEFRQALALDPDAPFLRFNLGVALMQMQRDFEGTDELQQELTLRPKGPHAAKAAELIANPRRARELYAADFSVVTLSKELLGLGDLRGKVVVLDFWGTWCQPCVAALPWLRDLQRRHAKDPFVLLGISADTDEALLREFVEKARMEWPEYLDRDKKVHRSYDVRAWPTYVLIDDEGIVRLRTTGNNPAMNSRLESEIKAQLKRAAARQKAN